MVKGRIWLLAGALVCGFSVSGIASPLILNNQAPKPAIAAKADTVKQILNADHIYVYVVGVAWVKKEKVKYRNGEYEAMVRQRQLTKEGRLGWKFVPIPQFIEQKLPKNINVLMIHFVNRGSSGHVVQIYYTKTPVVKAKTQAAK